MFAHKLDEMEKFLKRQKLPKLTQEKIDHLNGSTTNKKNYTSKQKSIHKGKPKPR